MLHELVLYRLTIDNETDIDNAEQNVRTRGRLIMDQFTTNLVRNRVIFQQYGAIKSFLPQLQWWSLAGNIVRS